ncbi:MAG: 50S ribosomal protein L25 [Desulfobacteraceae bacterium]|nr:50S ribosomal protein L25 [Desulfobacteraceae bacterium]
MELIDLNAKTRETKGKGAARKLRSNNAIPAIAYGVKTDPVKLSIDTAEFTKIIRLNGSTGLFFNLKIEGDKGKDKIAMLKEIQMDTFGLNYLHLDLHEIDMDTKVTVSVPVEPIGESEGVKEGGILQIIRRELDVICKPADTPDSIQIDISELLVGDSVHVDDLDLGDAVEIPHEVNFTLLTVITPTVEEEVEEEEEELEEGELAEDGETSEASEETTEE